MMKMADNNSALTHDVRRILDNKQRLEGENFLLKKEIQRVKMNNRKVGADVRITGADLSSTRSRLLPMHGSPSPHQTRSHSVIDPIDAMHSPSSSALKITLMGAHPPSASPHMHDHSMYNLPTRNQHHSLYEDV